MVWSPWPIRIRSLQPCANAGIMAYKSQENAGSGRIKVAKEELLL